jgi:hypothetical protein
MPLIIKNLGFLSREIFNILCHIDDRIIIFMLKSVKLGIVAGGLGREP